jgi:hypothetical protein
MGDMAKGVKAFKTGLKEEDEAKTETTTAPPQVTAQPVEVRKDPSKV